MAVNSVAYPPGMATMKPRYRKQIRPLWVIFASLLWVTIPAVATADVTVAHAISLYGQPKYPQGFQHFDYVHLCILSTHLFW